MSATRSDPARIRRPDRSGHEAPEDLQGPRRHGDRKGAAAAPDAQGGRHQGRPDLGRRPRPWHRGPRGAEPELVRHHAGGVEGGGSPRSSTPPIPTSPSGSSGRATRARRGWSSTGQRFPLPDYSLRPEPAAGGDRPRAGRQGAPRRQGDPAADRPPRRRAAPLARRRGADPPGMEGLARRAATASSRSRTCGRSRPRTSARSRSPGRSRSERRRCWATRPPWSRARPRTGDPAVRADGGRAEVRRDVRLSGPRRGQAPPALAGRLAPRSTPPAGGPERALRRALHRAGGGSSRNTLWSIAGAWTSPAARWGARGSTTPCATCSAKPRRATPRR